MNLLLALAYFANVAMVIAVNPSGCTKCDDGSIPKAKDTQGCLSCGTIPNSATGAVVTCAFEAGKTTLDTKSLDLTAAASGNQKGRKCEPGFFFVAKTASAAASCTACKDGAKCDTCTDAASGNCTIAAAGNYLKKGVATACSLQNDAACSSNDPNKLSLPVIEACSKEKNLQTDLDNTTGCQACPDSKTPNLKSGVGGCIACTDDANKATGATLTCTCEATKDTIEAQTIRLVAAPATSVMAGRFCKPGFFNKKAAGTAGDKCTACKDGALCDTCTDAASGNCTIAAAGNYLKKGVATACNAQTDLKCGKGKRFLTKVEGCTTVKNLEADLDATTGCIACEAGKFAKDSTAGGCVDCTAITNAAAATTTTCAAEAGKDIEDAKSSDIPTAAASGNHKGRKCKPGYFFVAKTASAAASCTACKDGAAKCHTCSSVDAKACTAPQVGHAVVAGVAKACTPTPVNVCTKEATNKVQATANTMCPVLNTCDAVNSQTVAAGTVATCPIPTPAPTPGKGNTASSVAVSVVSVMIFAVLVL